MKWTLVILLVCGACGTASSRVASFGYDLLLAGNMELQDYGYAVAVAEGADRNAAVNIQKVASDVVEAGIGLGEASGLGGVVLLLGTFLQRYLRGPAKPMDPVTVARLKKVAEKEA